MLTMGWASYAWEQRCRSLTHTLQRECVCGEELRRLCSLASCSPALRMELQAYAEPDTQSQTVSHAQEMPRPDGNPSCLLESSHGADRQNDLTSDMIGGSSGMM